MARILSSVAILAVVAAISPALGTLQKLTLYEKPDQQGQSIAITANNPNFTVPWTPAVTSSFCVIGEWELYEFPKYFYNYTFNRIMTLNESCENLYSPLARYPKSVRHFGPEDLSTPAISFREKKNSEKPATSGREFLIIKAAANLNFPDDFELYESYLFGRANWTLFSEPNFGGNSTCFETYDEKILNNYPFVSTGWMSFDSWFPDFSDIFPRHFIPRSVVRGCDRFEVANNINLFLKDKVE